MPRLGKGKKKPKGYEVIEPVIEALENEIRDKVKESNVGIRNTESMWPVMQIGWQRSRYIYDMFYTYKRISREVYDFCIKNKIADASLIAKWKKPGYERLCSTYVINPSNYKFATVSICRVPMQSRTKEQKNAQDPTTGCLGCASGKESGPRNIFGNKYGQNLAAVQIARERRMEAIKKQQQEQAAHVQNQNTEVEDDRGHSSFQDDAGESETDDESTDEEDYGPVPPSGVWAGSQKLQEETQAIDSDTNEDIPSSKRKKIS